MKISDRVRSLRLQKGITQKDLGELLGVSTVSVNAWENDKKIPSIQAAISMSEFFDVSIDYLLCLSPSDKDYLCFETKSERNLIESYRSLDIYGKKVVETICNLEKQRIVGLEKDFKVLPAAGNRKHIRYIPKYNTPSAAGISAPLECSEFEMIEVNSDVPLDADYAVKIQGDSMVPYIYDGDTVFVQKDVNLSVGDIGIFCVDGAMYCKEYYMDNDGNLTLVSANPDLRCTNIHISADSCQSVSCCGKVLGFCSKLPKYFTDSSNL